MSGNTDTQDFIENEWSILMQGVLPYAGSDISVTLVEDGKPVRSAESDPEQHFSFLNLDISPIKFSTPLGFAHVESKNPVYEPKMLEQIKHQSALRLERLAEHFENVDFSMSYMDLTYGYVRIHRELVTPELIGRLISPNLERKLDMLDDPWSLNTLEDKQQAEKEVTKRLEQGPELYQ